MKLLLNKPETFDTGTVLILSPRQALLRVSSLDPLGDGAYMALSPQFFKAGEEIGLPDCYELKVEPIPEPTPEPTPEPIPAPPTVTYSHKKARK